MLKCKQVPDFQYHDLYHYVVFNPSPYSGQAMKAYKSLDAYSYFVAGWVTGLQQWIVPGNGVHLVHAKVSDKYLYTIYLLSWVKCVMFYCFLYCFSGWMMDGY